MLMDVIIYVATVHLNVDWFLLKIPSLYVWEGLILPGAT